MKILSEEDGDTIWNDPLEMHEPISNNPSPSKGLLRATNNKTNKHSVTSATPSLDKRLQEILDWHFWSLDSSKQENRKHISEAIAAIHSAFKDAGYFQTLYETRSNFLRAVSAEKLMTGQAWLDRFTEELEKLGDEPEDVYYGSALVAARRASGIEEDSQRE